MPNRAGFFYKVIHKILDTLHSFYLDEYLLVKTQGTRLLLAILLSLL